MAIGLPFVSVPGEGAWIDAPAIDLGIEGRDWWKDVGQTLELNDFQDGLWKG